MFSGLGYGDDADMIPLAESLLNNPPNAVDAGAFTSVLTPDFARILQTDLCKVLFAEGELDPSKMAWLEQFQSTARLTDWGVLGLFSRNLGDDASRRTQALNELGLGPEATDEDIKNAYRKMAMQYHPDRQDALAPHLRELIGKKMAALNDAYEFLTNQQTPGPLYFQDHQGRSFCPSDGIPCECKCWLCGQMLRVAGHADLRTVRCSKCHALSGLLFDPTVGGTPPSQSHQPPNTEPAAGWNWNWAWIAVVVVVIGALYLYNRGGGGTGPPDALGRRLPFGKCEVFFTTGVEQAEAQKLGELLVREKYFSDRPATVQVRKQNQRYELRCVVRADAAANPEVAGWEDLGNTVSRECFRAFPVDIHLCDENLKTLRVVAFQPKPLLVEGLKAGWDTGAFTHDFLLTNGSGSDLREAEIIITLYREDGQRVPVKKFWSSWKQNETKRVNVPSHRYQKMDVQGTAIRGLEKVRIDTYWTQTWN